MNVFDAEPLSGRRLEMTEDVQVFRAVVRKEVDMPDEPRRIRAAGGEGHAVIRGIGMLGGEHARVDRGVVTNICGDAVRQARQPVTAPRTTRRRSAKLARR